MTALRRLLGLLALRRRRFDLVVALLLAGLGFAVVVQVRSTRTDGLLTSARQEDLVQILDDLANRSDRLRQEVASLSASRERLSTRTGASEAALADARRRTQLLGVLAGTSPATGPGITVTVTDPRSRVGADVLLDALEELRDAGAEAVQIEGPGPTGVATSVRVVASTSLLDRDGGVAVDGSVLRPAYRFVVIGDPATLAAALAIPGGVVDTVRQQGGTARIERVATLRVGALRALDRPRYARPAPATGG